MSATPLAPPSAAPAITTFPPRVVHRPRDQRADIQGLRALAVTLVVAFHAGARGLTGGYVGVDVFFVISGFLITGHLLRFTPGRPVGQLVDFYGRRILRLLPVAGAVIVATIVMVRLIMPPLSFPAVGQAGRASALYYINIFLANNNISYLSDSSPSPFQHYWSLAVEEQFYVLWPVSLLILGHLVRRRRAVLAAVVALGCVLSLGLSVYLTAKLQPLAFFQLPPRAWEFGLGALLAIAAPTVAKLRGRLAVVTVWTGVAAIAVAALTFDGRTPFPGYTAALPALGTALVIAGGTNRPAGGLERIASWGPIAWIGAASYSIYLWHWPLLIVPSLDRADPLSVIVRAGLVAATLVLAALSYRWIEQPFRRSRWLTARAWRPFGLAAVVTVVTVVVTSWGGTLPAMSVARALPVWPAGAATSDAPAPSVVGNNLTPALATAATDQPVMTSNACIADFLVTTVATCTYGDAASTKTVVLFGDSHAQQWLPGITAAADAAGFKVVSVMKLACPAATLTVYNARLGRAFTECDTWRRAAFAEMQKLAPDVVIAGSFDGSASARAGEETAQWAAATTSMVESLPAGSQKVVLADGPNQASDRPTCLSEHIDNAAACSAGLADLAGNDQRRAEVTAASAAGAQTLDMAAVQCPAGTCQAIMWNVEVYRDQHHVTATFARHASNVFFEVLNGA